MPEWRRVIISSQPLFTMILAICFVVPGQFYTSLIRYEVVYQLVSYNFMAFGFTIAALAIIFAIPSRRFINLMFEASARNPERGAGPWEDALFIMAWNGIVHFSALIASLSAMAFSFDFNKDHSPFIWDALGLGTKLTYFLMIWLQLYALVQFLMTLLSIFFFCSSYIRDSRREWVEKHGSDL